MKQFLLLFLAAALPIIGFAQPLASSIPNKKSDVRFEIAPFKYLVTGDNTVSLVGYDYSKDPNNGVVEIPSSVTYQAKSYSVTEIVRAFLGKTKITSVTIPLTVKSIGTSSFNSCWNLTQLKIPASVTHIESRAFFDCRNLRMVEIESLDISINNDAFAECNRLSLFKINSDKIHLGKNVFWKSSNIKEVQVKSNCRSYFMGLKSNPHIVVLDEPRKTTTTTNTYIAATPTAAPQQTETKKIVSDVDQNIPQTSLKNDKTFAVIIANEKYATESTVDFALNDGKIFKEYCEKTLGIPTENIRFVENGTLGSIGAGIEWLQKVLEVYKQDANAIVYYSGHGIPNEATGDAYLLPTDCQGSNFKYAYSINRLYKELGEAGAKSVTYFIDACFSGTQRKGEMMVAARGVAIKAKSGVLSGNSVAFAAASGDETAFAYEEKGHGMFTYFLLKKLQETKGEVSYGELADYIQQNVKQKSIVVSPRLQSPNAISSSSASEGWHSWKLTK